MLICLKLPIVYAAVGAAAVNTLVGMGFLIVYRAELRPAALLWVGHGALALLLVVLAAFGTRWMANLGDTLFKDRVVYSLQTPFQNVVLTKRHVAAGKPDVLSLYINGALQFASNDERIYHAYLTTPAMLAAYRRERVLILGGGDGLALRDVLRWQPQRATLIDIDPLAEPRPASGCLRVPARVLRGLGSGGRERPRQPHRLRVPPGSVAGVPGGVLCGGGGVALSANSSLQTGRLGLDISVRTP